MWCCFKLIHSVHLEYLREKWLVHLKIWMLQFCFFYFLTRFWHYHTLFLIFYIYFVLLSALVRRIDYGLSQQCKNQTAPSIFYSRSTGWILLKNVKIVLFKPHILKNFLSYDTYSLGFINYFGFIIFWHTNFNWLPHD